MTEMVGRLPPAEGIGLALDRLAFALLLAMPLLFLSVQRGVNLVLPALLLVALAGSVAARLAGRRAGHGVAADSWFWPLVLAFSALFLATGLTQALRATWYWPSFDGPARILLAAPVFLYLRTRNVSAHRALDIGIPTGLLLLPVAVWLARDNHAVFAGRFTTGFVDPNTLGSQATVLTLLCLLSVGLFGREKPWLLALKGAGVLAGTYVSLHAQSRGGWMAVPAVLLLWILLQRRGDGAAAWARRLRPLFFAVLGALLLLALTDQAAGISGRIGQAVEEVSRWLGGSQADSSSGRRLTMWNIALTLARESPWLGYGETGFQELLASHPVSVPAYRLAADTLAQTGPHADLLAKLLSMGLVGVLAFAATLGIPFLLFWHHRADADAGRRGASHLGLFYVVGLFVAGLTNEMLSLKYLCTFFGLMVAGLAADLARPPR